MAPSDDSEALFHINDIRFGAAGKNIICLSCFSDDNCATQGSIDSTGYKTDMRNAYAPVFEKSENITAFMTVYLILKNLKLIIFICTERLYYIENVVM